MDTQVMDDLSQFVPFPKIPRMNREIIVTEKIDGTNASIHISNSGEFRVASRNRFITPEDDNFGFAAWAYANKDELMKLGPGRHFGEWYGRGIQHGYGLQDRRFMLFNVDRWADPATRPAVCEVATVLYRGPMSITSIAEQMERLKTGSVHVPGWSIAEGVVIFHTASNQMFKVTVKNDESPKGKVQAA